MTVFLDTSAPGGPGPITTSGQVFYFAAETHFYITAISTLIAGQSTGPSVTFTIYSRASGNGIDILNVDYGQPATAPSAFTGYLVQVTVPAGNPVTVRCVISDFPVPLGGTSLAIATNTGNALVSIGIPVTAGAFVFGVTNTCPVNQKWRLLRAYVTGTAADLFTLVIVQGPTLLSAQYDYITAKSGTAIPGTGKMYIGEGAGNDIQLPAIDMLLLPGDAIGAMTAVHSGTCEAEILQTPL